MSSLSGRVSRKIRSRFLCVDASHNLGCFLGGGGVAFGLLEENHVQGQDKSNDT